MSYHWSDNVHTSAFTPRDYQVELLAAAVERNILICVGHKSSKEFIALKLLQEFAHQLRRDEDKKMSVYLTTKSGDSPYNLIYYLTDLKVLHAVRDLKDNDDQINVDDYQVLIINPVDFLLYLETGELCLERVNLMIIEDCHEIDEQTAIFDVFKRYYSQHKNRPKVLALGGPIHSANCAPQNLKAVLEILERNVFCKAETASDIVTVLRYCSKPSEFVLQCAPPNRDDSILFLEELINTLKAFLQDHRYDLSEIFGGDFIEEVQGIPDPKIEPTKFLDNYLEVLHEMGPWSADRVALNLLYQIEKLKVKTPYERHFLLLGMVTTTFVKIRAFCDSLFKKCSNERERIEKYSSPKILRLLETLRLFKPEKPKGDNERLAKITDDLNNLDFHKLELNLENVSNHVENLDKTPVQDIVENLESILHKQPEVVSTINNTAGSNNLDAGIRTKKNFHQRHKRRNPTGRRNRDLSNDPDALCGIIFCNHKNTAKVLFDMLLDLSRNDPDFSYLSVLYTVDRVADPITEPKEAEQEHRRQEEVLKRFRMHECNLIIGTSVLEEGIDLPKCNLVIRWDPPTTYRSYVQCKGRARASQAYHVVLVSPKINDYTLSVENEMLSDDSHRYICEEDESDIQEENDSDTEIHEIELKKGPNCQFEIISMDNEIEKLILSESISSGNKTLDNNECYIKHEKRDISKHSVDEEAGYVSMKNVTNEIVDRLAQYRQIEKMLLLKCANREPLEEEHLEADQFTACIAPYKPMSELLTGALVDISSSIALINKYCAKLPSDTFTKLTPLWRLAKSIRCGREMYQYTIRLPINSPLKYDVLGVPMSSKVLARRVAALQACAELHKCGELDNNLQPIGKEGFKAFESDWESFELEKLDEQIVNENAEPRPGTTKRRQYYYKRIASEFSNCRPTAGATSYLYFINLTLKCPIPEEQNTRGRKIYPPEESPQGFGVLTLNKIPKVSAFPIFTRSGEVKVSLELSKNRIVLTEKQITRINTFLNYTFTNVLRLQKFLMLFDPEATENCVFIVPTIRTGSEISIDWDFLETIYNNCEKMPKPVPDNMRKNQEFDANKFKDAVVMPWYRNQDQPQYFYVAEICNHLSPESSFPGENYKTFKEYYFLKYDITIQNTKQPLLDVDHTSARLNFLTPRYVNRKGVALPTSSEETKRAKRENLEQKQILVPELCTIHPFPASLWRTAVCLPCILYRINGLLLADEIRKKVSFDLALGRMDIEEDDFQWPLLDFGWSLAEVLKKCKETGCCPDEEDLVEVNRSIPKSDPDENGLAGHADGNSVEEIEKAEKSANDRLQEAEEKLKADTLIEIGTWSNDMANNISNNDSDFEDEDWGLLPPNVNLCSTNNTNIRYGSPTSWDVGESVNNAGFTRHQQRNAHFDNYFSDSDNTLQSDDDYDSNSIASTAEQTGPLRIEFKPNNVAEAVETEEEILKRQKQMSIIHDTINNERIYQDTKNLEVGYNFTRIDDELKNQFACSEMEFIDSTNKLKMEIQTSGMVLAHDQRLSLPKKTINIENGLRGNIRNIQILVPYLNEDDIKQYFCEKVPTVDFNDFQISIDDLKNLNQLYLKSLKSEKYIIEGSGDLFDNFNDANEITISNETKAINMDFKSINNVKPKNHYHSVNSKDCLDLGDNSFSFDYQPKLEGHPGPSPSIILQALTMSNANDGINLERLETIGDSFLKYAITTYLYITYENVHEGKLSHLRSKQVANLNLYRLGRKKVLGECMIATKFEPHDNWLPPCYYVPKELEKALIEARIPPCHWNLADLPNIKELSSEEICELVKKKAEALGLLDDDEIEEMLPPPNVDMEENSENFTCFIPYNLVTQHSIPDKSVADCVEALIGAYLIECGPRGALLFMAWLGIRVLPVTKMLFDSDKTRLPGSSRPINETNLITIYGEWNPPKSPLLTYAQNPLAQLNHLLDGYDEFEKIINYRFRDRSYLLQAMTHASYSPNRLTDCYQRLEFLGDAVLDYLITRHLYEDPRQHSPGALTDLRSALVNNTIFASLAVRHGFHKYFRHLSPGLNEVIERFVRIQHENGHSISEEFFLMSEEECDDAEDVEVPKALGDVFESVAGAIFLDSNMSLDTVWMVYSNMMKPEIEQFSNSVPKSPIRELLELEPETAKFGKPEKLADGRRVRVTVEVFGKGTFRGIGRNYRIAKCTAAKCALRQLKKQGLISKKH